MSIKPVLSEGEVERLQVTYPRLVPIFEVMGLSESHYFARAIEQAVLQSPQIQALQEDADRYLALRQMNWFDSPLCVVVNPQKYLKLGAFCPSVGELDAAIDDAMGNKS